MLCMALAQIFMQAFNSDNSRVRDLAVSQFGYPRIANVIRRSNTYPIAFTAL